MPGYSTYYTVGVAPSGIFLAHFVGYVLHNTSPPKLPNRFSLYLNQGTPLQSVIYPRVM